MRSARKRTASPKAAAAAAAKRVPAAPRPATKRKRSVGVGRPPGVPARRREFDARDAAVQKRRRQHRNDLAVEQAADRRDAQLQAELEAAAQQAESAAASALRRATELDAQAEERARRAALHHERVKSLTPHAQGALPDQYVCCRAHTFSSSRTVSCAL